VVHTRAKRPRENTFVIPYWQRPNFEAPYTNNHTVCTYSFLLHSLGLPAGCAPELQNTLTLAGIAQGTTYQITYTAGAYANYRAAIDSIFEEIDQSFSIWLQGSLISRINRQ
jgi:thiamine biosynthesis lipoprotein ApbE